MTKTKIFTALATLALTAVGFSSGVQDLKGKAVPAFKLKRVGGGTFNSQDLKGKVVILDFWATWCGPCKAASPTMDKLYKTYGKKGLVVIGANVSDTDAAVATYAKDHSYPFAAATGYAAKLGVEALPVFLFIDRKGVVQRVDTGFSGSSPASWEGTVKKLVAKK
ncbi:TlpA family protein disulfide reductase [Fimbriimonas ginsengisoli]|uniref:Thioredoxin family protein n=1 Tax=Fimbriimonas ginsengisoli Gsoil 348 TaxID=661478 RepID=A0A068NPX5_FIMGI|nr:TlpA disulfide reductase family protein [Fimbriimonas ginsengisoli]AIE83639.1 thioredoxin family protein [Fimbriimonas ginsengisoli Gsoil 348]